MRHASQRGSMNKCPKTGLKVGLCRIVRRVRSPFERVGAVDGLR